MSSLIGSVTGTVTNLVNHPSIGEFRERMVTHWSIRVLQLGAAAGGIACVSAIAVQNYVSAAFYGALAISNLVGFYYLQRFIPQGSIEKDADRLEQLLETLKMRNAKLEETVAKAQDVADQAEDVRELSEKDTLKAERLVRQLSGQLAAKTQRLTVAVGALEQFRSLFDEVEDKRAQAVKEMLDLATSTQSLHCNLSEVEQAQTAFGEAIENLPTDYMERLERIQRLQTELQRRHDTISETAQRHLKQVTTTIGAISKELSSELSELEKTDALMLAETRKMTEETALLKETSIKINTDLRDIDKDTNKQYLLRIIKKLVDKNKTLKNQLEEMRNGRTGRTS